MSISSSQQYHKNCTNSEPFCYSGAIYTLYPRYKQVIENKKYFLNLTGKRFEKRRYDSVVAQGYDRTSLESGKGPIQQKIFFHFSSTDLYLGYPARYKYPQLFGCLFMVYYLFGRAECVLIVLIITGREKRNAR